VLLLVYIRGLSTGFFLRTDILSYQFRESNICCNYFLSLMKILECWNSFP